MSYDEHYAKTEAMFGTEPEGTLQDFMTRLKPSDVVLDIGAGQGRNAIFMAASGMQVHALEPSKVGGEAIAAAARRQQLDISVFPCSFEDFSPPIPSYAGIMVFGLIPDLDGSGITSLRRQITAWSVPGTLLWITGFTIQDPSFPQRKREWVENGPNTFIGPEGRVRTFLEPGQILELFPDWDVLHHGEGLGPVHRHGDGPPERHAKFEAVLERA